MKYLNTLFWLTALTLDLVLFWFLFTTGILWYYLVGLVILFIILIKRGKNGKIYSKNKSEP